MNEWKHQEYAEILRNCDLFVGVEDNCYHFFVEDNVMMREDIHRLRSNHNEADTRVCLHMKDVNSNSDSIVIRAFDTDIAIILLYHCLKFTAKIWMDVGVSSKNTRRYICITDIAQTLGPQLCASLPAFHAYSGCDYTSAFARKGKVRPFKLLEKETEIQEAFSKLADKEEIDEQTFKYVEKFTCLLYGAACKRKTPSMNEYRYAVVEKAYGPKKNSKNPFERLRGIDGCNIPPCQRELRQHIYRTGFVARMWAKADHQEIVQNPKTTDGWELKDGCFEPIMFEGPQIPDDVLTDDVNVTNADDKESDNDMEDDQTSSESDSDEDIA